MARKRRGINRRVGGGNSSSYYIECLFSVVSIVPYMSALNLPGALWNGTKAESD